MDIYDLMSLYFPRRKVTINRVRELDRSSREEAKVKAADYEAHGYMPKRALEDFLSTADIVIPLSRIDNGVDKVIDEINKLRKVVDGIGKVEREDGVSRMSAEPVLTFNWFPFTLSEAELKLYSDFVMKLIHKISNNESLFTP